MAIEIIKKGSQEKIDAWEKAHDKRKTWRCNRCGCEWKCEWKDNKFGSIQDYNGDPDILCPECNGNDTEEFVSCACGDKSMNCTTCGFFNGWVMPNRCDASANSSLELSTPWSHKCSLYRKRDTL